MQRLRTLAKCQLVAPVWGRHFNYVSLNRDLRSLFLRINKYQVDLNCSKLAKHVHEDLLKVVLERNAHPGLPKLPRLVDEATPGCFGSQLVGFDLYVDMVEGEVLSKAGQLSSRETQSDGIDTFWLRKDAEAIDGSTLEVARVTAGMPDTVHVFAELLATFSVRQLGPLEMLEQNLMCVPIDEGARPIKFGWKLHAYVGGLTDKHIAKLEAERDDGDDTLDITLLPTALLPHATKRLLVDKPRWKVVDAFRL